MASINPYITFRGNCEEAFKFYEDAFGEQVQFWGRFGDMPPQEGAPTMSEEDKNLIMHVSLQISHETALMGSDAMPGTEQDNMPGNISLSINTDSKEEADNLFTKLSDGGKVKMPLQETFWGAYFGMWEDKFGVRWMVNYDDPQKVKPH